MFIYFRPSDISGIVVCLISQTHDTDRTGEQIKTERDSQLYYVIYTLKKTYSILFIYIYI